MDGFTGDGELLFFHASSAASLGNQVTLGEGKEVEGRREGGGEVKGEGRGGEGVRRVLYS